MIPVIPTTSNAKAVTILASVLAALILAAVVGWWAYGQGYESADNKGKAALASREAEYARASANATAESKQQSESLAKRGNELSAELITTRRELAAARAEITRRIPDVAQSVSAACVFGPDFVRWWNDAAGIRAHAAPGAADSGGAARRSGEAGADGEGLRQDESVSLPALMAHHRDLQAYARDLEAVSAKRLQLLEAWSQ